MSRIPAPSRLITLTTDFGTRDGYAGAMKGVIRSTAPEAWVEDITHDIAPGDIRAGAWALRSAIPFFPRGTVHVVVVDPGVGTSRTAMIALADGQYLIGPDNGVFSWVLAEAAQVRAWSLHDRSWRVKDPSNTFHGRDLFAHAAALIAQEGDPELVLGGDMVPMVCGWARSIQVEHGGTGEIVHVDHFGNLVTNLRLPSLLPGQMWKIQVPGCGLCLHGLKRTYGEAEPEQALALTGSHGFLEIAVRQGSAARQLGLHPGEKVTLSRLDA
jgi:S-adenosyl-L-methionine hydrolase (adenosine-forming)